jgi:tetratricopeptide (TPR) repeat protein
MRWHSTAKPLARLLLTVFLGGLFLLKPATPPAYSASQNQPALAPTISQSDTRLVQACIDTNVDSHDASILAGSIKICTEALDTEGLSAERMAKLLLNRGVVFRNAGSFELSLADLDRAVELDPSAVQILRMRGWTLENMNRLPEALDVYDRALKMEKEPQGLLSRCVVLMGLKKFSDAQPDCEESLGKERNTDSLYLTAYANYILRSDTRAKELLTEAIQRKDAEQRSFLLLGKLLHETGKDELAIGVLKLGLTSYPDDKELLKKLEEISK